MAITKRVYAFNNPSDMISLAQAVQTGVYWGYTFTYQVDQDTEEHIGYKDFWDIVENEYTNNNAHAVIIEDDYVRFAHSNIDRR